MSKKVKLFCFPHAGGLANSYFSWKERLRKEVEVIPIELAGRGSRFNIPLCNSIEEITADTYKLIKPHMDGTDYAIFGHSMGALLTYEMVKKIKGTSGQEPIHLFFSGSTPIHSIKKEDKHAWEENKLKNYLNSLDSIASEAHQNQDIWELFLPILRSDIKNYEMYQYEKIEDSFNCNISVLYGYEDISVDTSELSEWVKYTNGECRLYGFEGGHFFLNSFEDKVLELIRKNIVKKSE